MFLTFGFFGRYLDFSLRYTLLVTLPDLHHSSILSERRSYLSLYIQVQEFSSVAGILFTTCMASGRLDHHNL